MTLRMEQVVRQLPGVIERYVAGMTAMQAGLERAAGAMRQWSEDETAGDAIIDAMMKDSARPYALSHGEPPNAVFDPAPFQPATVIAADGSSIDPDRFAALPCYVINVGHAVLPYSVGGEPSLGGAAIVGPGSGREPDVTGGGVNLLRDVLELERGVELACERATEGPIVLLRDGTHLPWDLDSPQIDLDTRNQLKLRTQAAFDRLRDCPGDVCVGAYISASRAHDVVNSLAALANDEGVAWPLADAQHFIRALADGQRSAVFRAMSQSNRRIESAFSAEQQACFFYVRAGNDIARVEVPIWAATPDRIGRLHATIVDQCARCNGYPRVLQEAHEQAVISGADRAHFSIVLENEADRAKLSTSANNKQMSKRRRAL